MIGTNQVLILYASRVPDPQLQTDPNATGPFKSDLRRVTYWLGSNGGLCRQDLPWYSADDAYMNNTAFAPEDDISGNESDYVIAKEVTDLKFEYYDVNSTTDDSGWNDVWYGSNPGPDGVTPCGPPTAIRITFWLKYKDYDGTDKTKQYVHVIPLLTANGPDINTGSAAANSTGSGTTSGN